MAARQLRKTSSTADTLSMINTKRDRTFKKKSLSYYQKSSRKLIPDKDESHCSKSYLSRFCNSRCLLSLFPLFEWLPHYQCMWLKRDVMAGITVAVLLVPQSLAFSTLAGLPPEWGLYSCCVPVILYVFWSTSPQMAVGPVAPTAIMVASAVESVMINLGYTSVNAGAGAAYDELYQSIAMTLSFVCGLILIVFGLIRAGFIVVFLSRPVMIGFIMAVGCIVTVGQFRALIGVQMDRYPLFYETLIAFFQSLHTINWYTTIISVISLFILFLPKCCLRNKIPKWVPLPLIVIASWILISYAADLEALGVDVVGSDIKSGFPQPKPPNLEYVNDVFASAFVIAIVSYMGSIALSKSFEQKTIEAYNRQLSEYRKWEKNNVQTVDDNDDEETQKDEIKAPIKPLDLPSIKLNPNMEFIAYGIANLIGAFFSSQVISSAFSRSALNYEVNGHTQITSVIQVIICVLCLLFLMPLLSPLPNCVLASLVTVSVYGLIANGVHELIFLYRVSRIELIEFLVAFIAPLIIGLESGIFLSIATSIFVNLLRHSFASIIYLGRLQSTLSDEAQYVDVKLFKKTKQIPHITIIEMKAELSFSNNNRLVDKIRQLLVSGNKYIVVSLNLTSFIDSTSIRQITTLFEDAKCAFICLSECRAKVIQLINRFETNTDEFPPNIKIFVSTHDAVLFLLSRRSEMMHEDLDSDTESLSTSDDYDDNINIQHITIDEGNEVIEVSI